MIMMHIIAGGVGTEVKFICKWLITAYAVTIYDNTDTDNTDITIIQMIIIIAIIRLIRAHKINFIYWIYMMEIQLK